jgi:hypothetical protein
VTYRLDDTSDDLSATPWRYPGTAPEYAGLLHGGRYTRLATVAGRSVGEARLDRAKDAPKGRSSSGRSSTPRPAGPGTESLDEALRALGVPTTGQRYLVVAVGSNASPAVMRRKLAHGGVSTTLPMVGGVVEDLGVGHMARVSRRGYLAAAPLLLPGGSTRVFASLLDEAQLECIDATEPGYVRRHVGADRCVLTLDGGERPSAFDLYVATGGVIARPQFEARQSEASQSEESRSDASRSEAIESEAIQSRSGQLEAGLADAIQADAIQAEAILLGPQEAVFACLRGDCPELAALMHAELHYQELMAVLARREDLRDAVRSCLQEVGWTTDSGLEDCPVSAELSYGELARTWAA